MEFKSFKLTENNCSTQNAVYEGCKTEDGVHLEYYMSSNDWDNELSCFVESRDVIRSVDDIIYVKLPTGKNAEGKFVFTDYPYWDKSK